MFFCYTCFSLVGVNQQEIPLIKVSATYRIIHNLTDGPRHMLSIEVAGNLMELRACQ